MRTNNPICAGCGKPLTSSYITALQQSWHEACFRCVGCQQPLGNERFFEHDDQPYHAACYHDRFSPRCAGCGRPIVGTFTTAQGKTWHPEHFLCVGGREPINGRSFHEHEGKVYCEDHYWQLFGNAAPSAVKFSRAPTRSTPGATLTAPSMPRVWRSAIVVIG